MALDENFKNNFSNWCVKDKRGLVSRGKVIGSKRGISCKCKQTSREIKISENHVRIDGEQYDFEKVEVNKDDIIIHLSEDKLIKVHASDFFG